MGLGTIHVKVHSLQLFSDGSMATDIPKVRKPATLTVPLTEDVPVTRPRPSLSSSRAQPGEPDGLAQMAATVFGTPMAGVWLFASPRQLAAAVGLTDGGRRAVSAVCRALVADATRQHVSDLHNHPRLSALRDALEGLDVRFFASAPLMNRAGVCVGVLCLVDSRPRRLSRQKQAALGEIARLAGQSGSFDAPGDDDDEILRRRARYLQMAEDIADVGHWRLNLETNDLFWSDKIFEIHGVTRDNYAPALESAIAFYHPDDRARVEEHIAEAIEQRRPFAFNLRIVRADGSVRHVSARGEFHTGEDGAAESVFGIFQDITDRVLARQELDRQQAELQLIFDTVPARIWYKDDKNQIVRLNASAARSMGMSLADAEGADTYALFPEMAKTYHEDDLEVIRSGQPKLGIVERYTPLDGEHGWVQTDKVPYTDPQTGQRSVFVCSTDITERVRAQDALRLSEERFHLAAQGASVGIWDWVDVAGDEEWWSPQFYRLIGYTPEELPASLTAFADLLHPSDHKDTFAMVEAHFAGTSPFRLEYRLRHKTDGYRWFLGSGQVMFDEAGKPTRMIGSIMDIHELKQTQVSLEKQAARLEKSNAELDKFAYVASHDLRAPLRGMDNLARWIEEDLGPLADDAMRDKLRLLRARVGRMECLLADILEYSRAGRNVSGPSMVDCQALLEEITALVHLPEGFCVATPLPLPTIWMSATVLEQILTNLVSNGIKHHDRASGKITVTYVEHPRQHEFCVEDDGPGIPLEFHDRVFEMFQTLERRDAVEGSGIGLSVVRKLVQIVAGRIALTSPVKERGTQFSVFLPKALKKASPPG